MSQRPETKKSPCYARAIFTFVLVILSPLIICIMAICILPWMYVRYIERYRLLRRVKNEWLPLGKYILFVYSDNPEWKEYAEKNIIPNIETHAVVLNYSQRNTWIHSGSLEASLFKNFYWGRTFMNIRMGGQEYNHAAIVFKPLNKPKVINFWKAFKEYQFGKQEDLQELVKVLLESV